MLDFCVNRFLRPNGDFTTDHHAGHFAPQVKKTMHWEFYGRPANRIHFLPQPNPLLAPTQPSPCRDHTLTLQRRHSSDFYAYLNQWWITAGVRLSRNDFVPQARLVRHVCQLLAQSGETGA